jgi:hypothetical protein
MSQRVISLGGGRGRGSVYVRSNLHRVEILCTAAKDAKCRYCCKSPKLLGDNFLAIRRSDPRPPIFTVSITLPRSPVSLSSGDEVSHIFTRKSRLKPGEFLITSAKGLLQQNLPGANIAAPLMSNACERNSAVAALSQKLSNFREKLTRAVRLRYKIIAARCSGFLFISAQGI